MQRRPTLLSRAFADHPRELGVGYLTRMKGALSVGASLIGAGAVCFVHAVVPGVLTRSASKTIKRLHGQVKARGSGASSSNRLDYEI